MRLGAAAEFPLIVLYCLELLKKKLLPVIRRPANKKSGAAFFKATP
jgi:hypothetical protein